MNTGTVQDNTILFTQNGRDVGFTNLPQGSVLPSDQSMVVLALRVFTWFRNPKDRGATHVVTGGTDYPDNNGDYSFTGPGGIYSPQQSTVADGNSPGSTEDAFRLYWQAAEQLYWSFGTGDKFSMSNMPTAYFPYGGGLYGDLGGSTDLIVLNNGTPDHTGILRLARAILIPPRQNIKCTAQIVGLPTGGNLALFNGSQGTRNMQSLTSNLNAPDLIGKVISFCFDGLFSRDVQ